MRAPRGFAGVALAVAAVLAVACGGPATNEPMPAESGSAGGNTMGKVILYDTFSDPATGWEREHDEYYVTDYTGDAYEIVNNDTNMITKGLLQGREVDDGDVEVTAQPTAGDPDIRFGLVLRSTGDSFIQAGVTGDGQIVFGVARYEGPVLKYRPQPRPFPKVRTHGEPNRLRVSLRGERATFYVNGDRAAEIGDAGIGPGDLGLFATSTGKPSRVLFTEFVLHAPPG